MEDWRSSVLVMATSKLEDKGRGRWTKDGELPTALSISSAMIGRFS